MDPTVDDERIDNLRRVRASLLSTARDLTGPRPDLRWAEGGLLGTIEAVEVAKGTVARTGRDDDVAALDSIRLELETLLPYADASQGSPYQENAKTIAASCFELSGRVAELGGYYPV